MEPHSDGEEDEEVAAALEARRATLEHLLPEEAATMLSKMPPSQAAQLLLLMGSGKRESVISELPSQLKETLGACLPKDAAEAMGLVQEAKADGEAQKEEGQDEEDVDLQLEARRATLMCLNAEEAASMLQTMKPEHAARLLQSADDERRTALLAALPSGFRGQVSESLTVDERTVQSDHAKATVDAAPKEDLETTSEKTREEPQKEEAGEEPQKEEAAEEPQKEEAAEELQKEEAAEKLQKEEAAEELQKEEAAEDGAKGLQIESQGAQHTEESEEKREEIFSTGSEAGAAGMSEPESAPARQEVNAQPQEDEPELVQLVEDDAGTKDADFQGESGIVETWLIGGKQLVREQQVINIPRRQPPRQEEQELVLDMSRLSSAQAAMQLAVLPDEAIVRHLRQLQPEESDAILGSFSSGRREELETLLLASSPSGASSSTAPGWVDVTVPTVGGQRQESGYGEENFSARAKRAASQALPPQVSQLGSRALGVAGSVAGLAKQGLNQAAEKAPEVNERASQTAAHMASAAGAAAGYARQGINQAADKVAGTRSAERAMGAASSAASVARQSMSEAAQKAGVAKGALGEAAGAAKQSINQLVSSSPKLEASGKLAMEVTSDAKQKMSGAAGAAKAGLVQMSKGMAGFLGKR